MAPKPQVLLPGFFVSGSNFGTILPLSWAPRGQTLSPMSSSPFPNLLPTPPLYGQIPHAYSLTKRSLSPKLLPHHFPLNLSESVPLKLGLLRIWRLDKLLVSYTAWTKAEVWTMVKHFPKRTKDPHRLAEEFNHSNLTWFPDLYNSYASQWRPGQTVNENSQLGKSSTLSRITAERPAHWHFIWLGLGNH